MSSPDTDTAIYSKLTGASAVTNLVATRVRDSEAPRTTTPPYVVFQLASGITPNRVPKKTFNGVYRVTAVSTVDAKEARTIAMACYDALHEQTLTLTGWTNYRTQVERETKFTDTDPAGDKWYRHILDVRILASKD